MRAMGPAEQSGAQAASPLNRKLHYVRHKRLPGQMIDATFDHGQDFWGARADARRIIGIGIGIGAAASPSSLPGCTTGKIDGAETLRRGARRRRNAQ